MGIERKKPPGIEQKQESMTEKNTENKNGRGEGKRQKKREPPGKEKSIECI